MAYRAKLWQCREAIISDLRAEDVLPYFQQESFLSTEDSEIIMHEITTRGRAQKLFRFLLEKMEDYGDEEVFSCATWAFRETYPHLADLLEDWSMVDGPDNHLREIERFLNSSHKKHKTRGKYIKLL